MPYWQEVAIEPYSDGDVRYWPGKPAYRPVSETHYMSVLAGVWVKARGLSEANVNYRLNQLPSGYGLFETDGPSAGITYKRLFGHPSNKYYDSAVRFQVHFLWLMGGMEGECECVLCSKKKPAPIRRTEMSEIVHLPSRPEYRPREVAGYDRDESELRTRSVAGIPIEREKRLAKPAESVGPVDEEGTEDIYKKMIQELYRFKNKATREDFKEKSSFDWRAERKRLPAHLAQIALQHSFVPRIGELVLWCPYFPTELDLVFNPANGFYLFYSFDQECHLGFPDWHGGVVVAVPSSTSTDGTLDFPDLLSNTEKRSSFTTSGFRIETLPHPNNDADRSLSKQYKYVPLRQIRPLGHWQSLLRGIPESKRHPSVSHAFTCMATVSLLEKFRFTGDWPYATIHCKGLYHGAELIVLGDAIRILPQPLVIGHSESNNSNSVPHPKCTDVLLVTSIRLHLHDIADEHAQPQSRHLSTSSTIGLVGHGYTLDINRAYRPPGHLPNEQEEIFSSPAPIPPNTIKSLYPVVNAEQYGTWFSLHAPDKRYEVSFENVLGRLHEPEAVRLWAGFNQTRSTTMTTPATRLGSPSIINPTPTIPDLLSWDVPSILSGRLYGTTADERIAATEPTITPNSSHRSVVSNPSPSTDSVKLIRYFWADTRVQALALATVNGQDVGSYDLTRDSPTLRSWRAMLRVIDGTATLQDVKDTRLPQRKGRQKGARLVDGRIVYPHSYTGLGGFDNEGEDLDNEIEEGFLDATNGSQLGRKRKRRTSRLTGGSQTTSPLKVSSQMVGAALEDGSDDDDDDDESDMDEGNEEPRIGYHRASDEDASDSDVDITGSHWLSIDAMARKTVGDDEELDEGGGSAGPMGVGGLHKYRQQIRKSQKPKPMPMPMTKGMSKMQMMSSIEEPHRRHRVIELASTKLGDGDNDDDEEDEGDEDERLLEELQGPPVLRGGTEESDGGDYHPCWRALGRGREGVVLELSPVLYFRMGQSANDRWMLGRLVSWS